MTREDVYQVASLYTDIRQDTVPVVHSEIEIAGWMELALLPRGSSFVFERESVILGWLDLNDGWVDQLYCRRGSTGLGIGLSLLNFAKGRSRAGLSLYTFQVNEGARRFYSREGFVQEKMGDGSENEEGEPDVLMRWMNIGPVPNWKCTAEALSH